MNNNDHIYSVAKGLWERDTEGLCIGSDSSYHWHNLAESAKKRWYSEAVTLLDAGELY